MRLPREVYLLFRLCNELRFFLIQAEDGIDVIREIAMNSSVASVQTGHHVKVFSEIANQISVTVNKVNPSVEKTLTHVSRVMNISLTMLNGARNLNSYQLAIPGIVQDNNHLHCLQAMERLLNSIQVQATNCSNPLYKLESELRNINHCNARLFSCASILKVESTDLYQEDFDTILALATHLDETIEKIHNNLDIAFSTVAQMKVKLRQINKLTECRGGAHFAKAYSV